MRILHRWLLARFATAFLGALLGLAVVSLVVDLTVNLDDVLATGSFGEALRLLALRGTAEYLTYLLPLAAFAAAFLSVGLAARAHEMLALRASGISPLRVVSPLLLASLALAGITLLLQETVAVSARGALRDHRAQGEDFLRAGGGGWYHAGASIWHVREPEVGSEALHQVEVFERDPEGRITRIVEAARAEREADGRWRFENGRLRAFAPDRPASAPEHLRFERTVLGFGASEAERAQGEPDATPIWTILEWVPSQREAARVREVLHQRLSEPLLVPLLTLLGVALGLRVAQTGSLARPAAEGIAAIFVLLTLREYGAAMAGGGAPAPAWVPWLTVLLFATLAGLGLVRTAR